MSARALAPGWQLVVDAIAHPCADGVVGDLLVHVETGLYRLQTDDELVSVPQRWAATVAAHEQAVNALVARFLAGEALTIDPTTIDPETGYRAVRRLLARLVAPDRADTP